MNKTPFAFLLLTLLTSAASAGTVSLTGTCQSNLMPGNTLNFLLVNNGNDTAYNLQLSPIIAGASPQNLSYPVNVLTPTINAIFLIPLLNISTLGTYIDAFVATYQQGSQVFTALFPCTINMGKATTSAVFLSVNTFSSGGTAIMNVSALNAIDANLSVNVSSLFPPSFTFITARSYILELGPYQTKKIQFVVQYPPSQGSYTGAIVDHYVYSNLSYSSFAPIQISQSAPVAQGGISPLLLGGIAVGAAIVLLIARSVLKKKRSQKADRGSSA
ncbi:MAG: hypothetical protein KGH54_01405 [Candidatus Micrarchaeota archaeon]|nr:hypothetical protein [Candidatus Micrarchaeota archaeon]